MEEWLRQQVGRGHIIVYFGGLDENKEYWQNYSRAHIEHKSVYI